MAAGCGSKNVDSAKSPDPGIVKVSKPVLVSGQGPVENQIPMATAFRMDGDFADKVAITLNADGKPSYFPDPSDITPESAPLYLGDGWWLNRQGISANSVFTTFTFSEYAKLKSAPNVEKLVSSVIPGAHVSEMVALPFNINEAQSHIPEIKSFLKNL